MATKNQIFNIFLVLQRTGLLVIFAIGLGHLHPFAFGYDREYSGYLLALLG